MAKVKIKWNGENLIGRLERAQQIGLGEAGIEWVDEAQHRVRRKTDLLHDEIKILKPVHRAGTRYVINVGVEGVPYAMRQERGPQNGEAYSYTPYLEVSLEIVAKRLASKIRKGFK